MELLALTAILALSLAFGLAATRLMLGTLLFFMMRCGMTRHGALGGPVMSPLAGERLNADHF